jgi:NAD(P)-dependent dehydrogenase (short-subunit alcohol dehydrogenase family)
MQHATRRFEGKDVVVTGGSGALGSAVVGRLLAEGARVHVPWLKANELEGWPHAGKLALSKVNLESEAEVGEYYRSLPALYASVHVAGGFAMAPIVDTSGPDFERQWRLNALTAFLCCREAVRAMRRSGDFAKAGGRIVNVAARPVVAPVGGMIAYSASKAAVASITQSLAEETKAERILVNAVVPSIMDTPANRAAMPKADHASWPKVDDVAAAISFLASPDNAVTSGALVPVFGRA